MLTSPTRFTHSQSLKRIANAPSEDLSQLPGFGATKVKRIRDVFTQPFRVGETRTGRERREERNRLQDGDDAVGSNPAPNTSSQSSGTVSKGRFIRDEEDQQVVAEQEAEGASKQKPPVGESDPATYVKPKSGGVVANTDGDVEDEEVEDAGMWAVFLILIVTWSAAY